jgi:hypothetical protein
MGNVLSQLIAILGLVVAIIAASDQIVKNFRYVGNVVNRIPYIIFEVLVIAMSGMFMSAILWIVYDYFADTELTLSVVLITVASGAAWGMPVAVLSALSSKSLERTIVTSLFISLALLMLYDPAAIIHRPLTGNPYQDVSLNVMYSITMLIWVLFMGVASGYVGFKTKIFVDGLLEKTF